MLKSHLSEVAGLCFLLAAAAYALEIRAAFSGSAGTLWGTLDLAAVFSVASFAISLIAYMRLRQRRALVILVLGILLFVAAEYIRVGGA